MSQIVGWFHVDHSSFVVWQVLCSGPGAQPTQPLHLSGEQPEKLLSTASTPAVIYLQLLHGRFDPFELRLCIMYAERPADFPDTTFNPSTVLHGGQSDT